MSADRGRTWRARKPPQPLIDLVADSSGPARLVAAGNSRLFGSPDGGRSWRELAEGTGLLAWPAAERLYLLAGDGHVWWSPDAGRRWRRSGSVDGEPAAFLASGPRALYAALHDGTIKHSDDGGRTWTIRSRP